MTTTQSKGDAGIIEATAGTIGITSPRPRSSCCGRGSLVERYKKCGKRGCHCAHDRGPAYYLPVTLAPGKMGSYYVPPQLPIDSSRGRRPEARWKEPCLAR